jgi:hypothetical protein
MFIFLQCNSFFFVFWAIFRLVSLKSGTYKLYYRLKYWFLFVFFLYKCVCVWFCCTVKRVSRFRWKQCVHYDNKLFGKRAFFLFVVVRWTVCSMSQEKGFNTFREVFFYSRDADNWKKMEVKERREKLNKYIHNMKEREREK